jgi:hypothetical protein
VDSFRGLAALYEGEVNVTLAVAYKEICDLPWVWSRLQYAIGPQHVVGLTLQRDDSIRLGRVRVELAPMRWAA